MANKEIDDLTAFTTQPASTDVFVFKRITAAVTRSITFLNLTKFWWVVKTTTYTASAGDKILANTTTAAWTFKLPASPVAGDDVWVRDSHGKFNTNNLTVDRNGSKIRAAASNLTLNTQWQTVHFVFVDSTAGWTY